MATVVSAQVKASEVEIRGEVFSIGNTGIGNAAIDGFTWDSKKFAGFWYDIDEDRQTEKLEILKLKDSRTIDNLLKGGESTELIKYDSHNVDTPAQNFALMVLFDKWVEYADILRGV